MKSIYNKIQLATVAIITFVSLQSKAQKEITLNLGHQESINAMALSPNEKYLLTGGGDRLLKIWDIKTGKELKTIKGHEREIEAVNFSSDGKYFISASDDNRVIKIWITESGRLIRNIKYTHRTSINAITFSPDNKYIYSCGWDMKVKKWDFKTGKELMIYNGHTHQVMDIKFLPDPSYFVTAGKDGLIILWNADKPEPVKVIEAHDEEITGIDISSDGKYVVSGNGVKLTVWKLQTGKEIFSSEPQESGINSVAYSPNGEYVASGSWYGKVKLWNAKTGREIGAFTGHTSSVMCLLFDKTGEKLYSTGRDCSIRIWDVKSEKEIKNLYRNIIIKNCATLSHNNNYVALAGEDKNIQLWNIETGKYKILSGHKDKVYTVCFSPEDKYIISGGKRDAIRKWNVETGELVKRAEGKQSDVVTLTYSPDGKRIASGSMDQSVLIWNAETLESLSSFKEHNSKIADLAFGPKGKTIASAEYREKTILWDIETSKQIQSFIYKGFTNKSIAYNPNGKELLTGHDYGIANQWSIKTGKKIRENSKNMNLGNDISSVAYSSDGKYFLMGCGDNSILLWESESGMQPMTYYGHQGEVKHVEFSSDDKRIISTATDGTVRFWDRESGELLITLAQGENIDQWVAFTPEGLFDGTEEGIEMIHYVDGMNIITLSALYEQYYTPNLLPIILKGGKFEKQEIAVDDLTPTPLVEITSPQDGTFAEQEVLVKVVATDEGGGIDEVRLYLNDKLVETTNRGFKPLVQNDSTKSKFFKILLSNGENKIKAIAYNDQRTASIPHEVRVKYKGAEKHANLYMLIVGINDYKNPRYALNYALADANSFKESIEKGASEIYKSTEVTLITNPEATRSNILENLEKIKLKAKPEDVFIFYYAGHGVMSEEAKPQFYMVPYDITQLYGNNKQLTEKAISANELQEISMQLKAQKQLFVFDACQSGGATSNISTRGAAKEKAIAQLARSTGTYWLAASNSNQFATEFAELGHGLFTYCILQGLKGKADGGAKDKKITVKELNAYLNNEMPELSTKYKGTAQYPSSFGFGMDFPIVICK